MAAADATVAAIASDLAAQLYRVPILRAGIEDNPHNSTRFLVVGRQASGPTGRDKTSILFAMRNEPGTLYRILEPLAPRGSTSRRSSRVRPSSGPGSTSSSSTSRAIAPPPRCASALDEIEERDLFLKVLGSYPAL